MFFDSIPKITYAGLQVADVTKHITFLNTVINNDSFWFTYELRQNELPEHVAHDYYGRSDYHWIILTINNVLDPIYDWYLSDQELASFVTKKYGVANVDAPHHWDLNGVEFNYDPGQNAVVVTNQEFEDEINDVKRIIKVVYPEYIDTVLEEYKIIIEEAD